MEGKDEKGGEKCALNDRERVLVWKKGFQYKKRIQIVNREKTISYSEIEDI